MLRERSGVGGGGYADSQAAVGEAADAAEGFDAADGDVDRVLGSAVQEHYVAGSECADFFQ